MINWNRNIETLSALLRSLSVWVGNEKEINSDSAFEKWKNKTIRLREEKKNVYLVGNGASASMASHLAADLAQRGGVGTGSGKKRWLPKLYLLKQWLKPIIMSSRKTP